MEIFFLCCSEFDEIELKELLLRKYNGIDFILAMNICEFYPLAKRIVEKEREDLHRAQWNQLYPYMAMKMLKYFTFNDYYDMCTGKNVDMRPADEIIAEIKELHHME